MVPGIAVWGLVSNLDRRFAITQRGRGARLLLATTTCPGNRKLTPMGRGRGNRHTSPEEYIAKKTQKLGKCLAPTGDDKRKEHYLLEVLAAMECGGRPQLHDRVRVIQGEKWVGYVGVVVHDVQDNRPFKIRLLYGPPTTVVGWFTHADLIKWDNPEKLCKAID